MGLICIERATGAVREWVRHGQPGSYDPAVHDLLEAEAPPPNGARWDGTAFVSEVKPPSPVEVARVDARAKIDLVVADPAVPRPVREALAAIKRVLG